MIEYLALTLPGGQTVQAPAGIPSGGITVVGKVIANSITILLIVAVVITLFGLIWGGIQWISSGGDKAKLGAARARITYSLIGLLVALFSFLIVGAVGYLFKVNLFNIG